MIKDGLYEALINQLLQNRLDELGKDQYHINEIKVDKAEASKVLSNYTINIIHQALSQVTGDNPIEKQIDICNNIIHLLRNQLNDDDFEDDLIDTEGRILTAVFTKLDARFSDIKKYLKEITPYSGLTQSELFTGSNVGISMESEIKKEIRSSDRIHFLVSFIKWTGIRIFEKELKEFTNRGGQLRIITTSYMGATDAKAVEFLASLPNTEIKVSYNTTNERLHAKAYLFLRNTGYHTGYIGSSNISRSALTNGLEWNIKLTTKEVSHIIEKFRKTFDTYWQNNEFEFYDANRDLVKLRKALKNERTSGKNNRITFFDVKPYHFQEEILEKLNAERVVHNRLRNLVVAATGTGKTVISAFDFKRYRQENPTAKLLFVAHRKEILEQAQSVYQGILRDANFGELWVNGLEPERYDCVFASVQTLGNRLENLSLSESFYDFIIIDEVHHIKAASYRPILERFKPSILLGLTATPERMDGADVLADFCNVIAAEIRLPQALNKGLLCPFQYFGVTDNVDLSKLNWQNGKYMPSELTKIYTEKDNRVRHILENIEKYVAEPHEVRALCFCVTQEHAKYMAEKFSLANYKADYLTSQNNGGRDQVKDRLLRKEINYLFVVDIFNEGVDIPEIDTVLFLRPTESLTVFLQQLGRGLRLSDNKDCLTVLDFVGNSRPEYDFEGKFRALIGKTNTSTQSEIENEFPHLPLGCSIVLEKKAKEFVLDNIKRAINLNKNQLIQRIRNFKFDTSQELTIKNFTEFYHIPIEQIYKKRNWKRLCADAGVIPDFESRNELEISRAIQLKWLSCRSASYFSFILKCANSNFQINYNSLSDDEKCMCLMLHYDVWQDAGRFSDISESIKAIGQNEVLVSEIKEVLELLIRRIDFVEKDIDMGYTMPLKVHGRYIRDQILSAFEFYSFDKKPSSREGVQDLKDKNTELLFITLNKSEKDYSPTTQYDDFALSDTLFHWQTQNVTRPDKGKGKSYIMHRELKKKILLFVREANKDQYGNTMGFVFLGEGNIKEHEGAKPMNIKWELKDAMPPYIWKDSAKMAIG
jgi:superfamily II DNA or RNA helicase